LIFNNKKSFDDFKLFLENFNISAPSKKKIKESVPFMNGSYDFSTVGSNGETVYEERTIKVRFNLKEKDRNGLYNRYSSVLEWLMGSGQSKIIFTDMPGYYFLGEVESAPDFEEVVRRRGILEVEFVCDPYKYGIGNYGDLLWNDVDFYAPDYIQQTSFTVSGAKTVNIGIPGSHTIVPKVVCNSNMICTVNGYTTTFTSNKSLDWQFKLKPGLNNIQISGTGSIDFQFQKEGL
jgi:predicted phage tail component-like protein